MPTINLPGGSLVTVSNIGSSVTHTSNFVTAFGRTMANGERHIYVQSLNLHVAGRSSTVIVRSHFAGVDGSAFSASAQSTPSLKVLPVGRLAIPGGTFRYGYAANGGTNFGRGSGGGPTYNSINSSTWPTALSGTYTYAEAPEAPTPIGIDQATATSLRARFSGNGNGGSTVTGWVLQYSKNSNFSGATTVASSGTSIVTGLDANTTYYFRAAGRNIVTDSRSTYGPWSTTFSGSTLASTPSAPQNVVLTPLSATQAKLDWTAPANNGGAAVTGYEVQWSQSENFSGAQSEDVGMALTWTSPSLDAGTWYFRVRAANANGDGTWSAAKSNVVTRTGYPKVFLGGGSVQKPVKVYLGGAWAIKPVKVYKDGQWITLL